MRNADKFRHGFRIHGIHISLVLKPGFLLHQLHISIPDSFPVLIRLTNFFLSKKTAVGTKPSVTGQAKPVGRHVIACGLFSIQNRQIKGFPVFIKALRQTDSFFRQQQKPAAVFQVPRHDSCSASGRESVIIIQPACQTKLFAALNRIFYKFQIFFSQIFRIQAGSGMNIHPSESHLTENGKLSVNQLPCHFTVPGPERNSPVFRRGSRKQHADRLPFVNLFIHVFSLFSSFPLPSGGPYFVHQPFTLPRVNPLVKYFCRKG